MSVLPQFVQRNLLVLFYSTQFLAFFVERLNLFVTNCKIPIFFTHNKNVTMAVKQLGGQI